MSLALIRPNIETELFKINSESLGIGYLSATLRSNGIETDIIDGYLENLKIEDIVKKVLDKKYKIIGFSIHSPSSLINAVKTAKLIKNQHPKCHIVIGGYTPSFDYEYIFKTSQAIDSILRFESEYNLLNLAKAILRQKEWREVNGLAFREKNKIIVNKIGSQILNLDNLPFPSRDYLPYLIENKWEEFTVNISRGRGCDRKCTFCNIPFFYTKPYRQRSNENLLKEILALIQVYGVNYFTFVDDVFYINSNRCKLDTIELSNKIKTNKLKINFSIAQRIDTLDEEIIDELISSGLYRIFIGLEAASQKILDKLDKKIRRKNIEDTLKWLLSKNIDIEFSFINFLPFNTIEDIRENINFFSQWGLDIIRSIGNRLEPNPGTSIHYELANEKNLIRKGFYFDYIMNNIDSKVDTLYKIIKPCIPFLTLISHQLRIVKTLLRKIDTPNNDYKFLHDYINRIQSSIVYEIRDILLDLFKDLEIRKFHYSKSLEKELYFNITNRVEVWLSYLFDCKSRIKLKRI